MIYGPDDKSINGYGHETESGDGNSTARVGLVLVPS